MTETTRDDMIGRLLADRFRVSSLIGRGGMATVYLADDETLGRTVALKVFRGDLAGGDDLQRQQDEIQLLATLNHPGLVTLFDASTDEAGNAFLVMELVEGTDLHSVLRDGPLSPGTVAAIGRNIADALVYVHARGIIHRDIKPGNLLLPSADGVGTSQHAKLADFGIARIMDGARLTATGKVLGTAGYFSPEQALGEPLTPASDIYSLGLVLLECLTGERSFPGTAAESMTTRLTRDPDVPAALGDSWAGLLRGMTSRDPGARPTARDVSGVLGRLSEPVGDAASEITENFQAADAPTKAYTATGMAAVKPLATERARPRGWRRPALITTAVAAALVIAWPIALTASSMFPEVEPKSAVEYPAVDGTLGTHLEDLQRSVEP